MGRIDPIDKSNMEKAIKKAKDITKDLLKKLKVDAKVEVAEKDSVINISLEGEDLGLLIGYHGENLEAMQLIIGLMVNKNIDGEEWVPVNLDVGGWRDERIQVLRRMVEKAVLDIESVKEPVELPPMSASQRRMVHTILADFPGFISESIGEEPNRKVVIKKA